MKENKSLQPTTSLRQRIILVLFGVSLFFALLEVGLRLGGFVLLSLQEYRNTLSIRQKGACRILCLGESTTQGQYPPYLEEILNQRNIGIRFSVIDKGIVGATTLDILGQLDYNINNYRPDMVVAMIGINDGGKHIPYEGVTTSKTIILFKSFRIYKLTRLLWLHILTKAKETGLYKPSEDRRRSGKIQTYLPRIGLKEAYTEPISTENSFKKAIELNPQNDVAYKELARFYQKQNKFSQAEDIFKKVIELNPQNDVAYKELARFYIEQNKLSQAEDILKKAIELIPQNDDTYICLGWLYQIQLRYSQAEDSFKKAIELNPQNYDAYIGLGRVYQGQNKFSQAEDSLKKAIELNPQGDVAYHELGWFYREQNKLSQAGDSFKKAVELNPQNEYAYNELGWFYQKQNKLSQAEDIFKKAIELNPESRRAYASIIEFYEEIGKPELAKEYAKKVNTARWEDYYPITVNNYHKLKEILGKRGIRLICVQYPMRNVEPLKKIFQGKEEGMLFVDNERIFKDALIKSSRKEYFKDNFAGDFGHCTEKGNRLLAENITNVILKEVFHK